VTLLEIMPPLLPSHNLLMNFTYDKKQLWAKLDNLKYQLCVEFNGDYREMSLDIVSMKHMHFMVVMLSDLNHQCNHIVYVVIIPIILEMALDILIIRVNVYLGLPRVLH